MKKFKLKLWVILLISIFFSCYNANYDNPNDRYTNGYIKDNAMLSEIIISDGELSPAFNPDTNDYTINLLYTITSITIIPIAFNDNSTILINGESISSGNIAGPFTIALGENEYNIEITSEDLSEITKYKITVNCFNPEFSSFKFLSAYNNSYLDKDAIGVIDNTSATITIHVPLFTDITKLKASFTMSSNASVRISNILQTSNVTENNFSSQVIYTVIDRVASGESMLKNYTVNVSIGYLEAYLKAPNNSNEDLFGRSISISGDTIAVGATGEYSSTTTIINGSDLSSTNNDGGNGAVYVFRRNGAIWSHEAYLKAPNNMHIEFSTTRLPPFGDSVAISGDTIVVGAPDENSTTSEIINGSDLYPYTNQKGVGNGAVYVYRRNGNIWSFEAYLKAPNNFSDPYYTGNGFGNSVSISGDTIAVGAKYERSTTTTVINGSDLSSTNHDGGNGAVYVFNRTGNIWSHEAYLKAPNSSINDKFGCSVSISVDTIAVGALSEKSTTNLIINGSDLSSTNEDGGYFGNGAVYVFKRNSNIWYHEAYLKAPNNIKDSSSYGDQFGSSVSISEDTLVVGAPQEESTTNSIINGSDLSSTNYNGTFNGAVYIFKRIGNLWSHEAYIKAPNNLSWSYFGSSVSIIDNIIAVGAPEEASTTNSIINGSDLSSANHYGIGNGAVYLFKRNGNLWSHEAYLKAPNNYNYLYFGSSISISGSTLVIGTHRECSTTTIIINGPNLTSTNKSGSSNGAVYVFQ